MRKWLVLLVGIGFSTITVWSQGKSIIVVQPFATGPGVDLPYDMKLLQTQLIPEFKVLLGAQHEIVAEAPSAPQGSVYLLSATITGWHPGNAAKRLIIGLGSGRESLDIEYKVADGSGNSVLARKDTVRTNFYSQMAGSSGTLAHPIAQKIAQRIKEAKLK